MQDKTSKPITFSEKTASLRQSGIRSASVRCTHMGGINLGQGVCDIPTHTLIKAAATDAIHSDKNIYAPHEGLLTLRNAVAKKIKNFNRIEANPQTDILISHGSTGSYVSAVKTLFNPGDEIILFEPFYGYHKSILELLGMKVVTVKTDPHNFAIDFAGLDNVSNKKTRGMVICSPCNPSGKIYSKQELIALGEFAKKHDLWVITDEIYEYITYPGYEHISFASLNDHWQRTVTISGFSKTYNVTGWRLGYAYAPAEIITKMALVHDLLYICPPTPLQHAMIAALELQQDFYNAMQLSFLKKRDLMVSSLRDMGFTLAQPQGAYYLMADFKTLGFSDDEAAATALLEQAKVATVPGCSFYKNPADGQYQLRFCFALEEDKLQAAIDNLYQFLKTT